MVGGYRCLRRASASLKPRPLRRDVGSVTQLATFKPGRQAMTWFLRKSFRLGPLRLNLSKGGTGASSPPRGILPVSSTSILVPFFA